MKIKRLLITTVAALAVALRAATTSHAATAHDPILFVHGWHGDGSNWAVMIANFKADGWTDAELNTWTYNSSQSNTTTAAQIRDRVDSILAATRDAKIDLVTHSRGALSSRYYIKNLGGYQKVDDWVSLAGPNHGTARATSCI